MGNFIDTEMLPVGKYLQTSKTIRVPEYQRSFAWTEDEVGQLWVDLLDSMDHSRAEYFIGPVVVKRSATEDELIDGQQRITTILLVIAAIRAEFRKNGDTSRADLLASYFGEKDIVSLSINSKFFMNEENGCIFRDFVAKEVGVEVLKQAESKYTRRHTNALLLQAYLQVLDLVSKVSGEAYNAEKLLRLFAYLTEHLKILVLSVDDESDAYIIFETLNDRGRSLDTLDLLKNHLFSKAKSHLAEVRQKWSAVRENLVGADPKGRFLQHYWMSMKGRTSTGGLFRSIKDGISSADEAVGFANSLAEGARVYEALQNPSSTLWDLHSQETKKNIGVLRLLDAQQALPILLAAESCFDHDEFRKLTWLLVVMAVRYNFIGEERTGVASNYYADVPKLIRGGNYRKASHVFNHIKQLYPNDISFRDAFTTKSISDSRRARYVLAEIENRISGSEKVVNSDPDEVNLEHVLPKNTNQYWSPAATNVLSDEHLVFVNRIGNLALVPKSMNKKSGNKEFSEKKEIIFSKCQAYTTTFMICEHAHWGRSAIEQRQVQLAEFAVATWKYEL